MLSQILLGAAREKGDIRLNEGDKLVYNTPPRPYISGVALRAIADQFNFTFIPDLQKTESMGFQERITNSFDTGLDTGIDILGSIGSVLVKMGERFSESAQAVKITKGMLRPRVIYRLLKGFLRSKIERRPMLPRDLWNVKVIPAGGSDTELYKDKIEYYWGVQPTNSYGCTEGGLLATHAWNKKDLIFFPEADFFEFIPLEEWAKWRIDPSYMPQTVLLNEVQPKQRYEVVITNFYGKPLLRYRTYDIIEFVALEDTEAGIHLPQFSFVGRSPDFIDIAGFIGLLDERMVWQAIINTGIKFNDWAIRKETVDDEPILKLYFETPEDVDGKYIQQKVHEALKEQNSDFADYEAMIEKSALEVVVVAPGAFSAYMAERAAAGADLAQLKPPHMNPSDETIRILMKHSHAVKLRSTAEGHGNGNSGKIN
jgi:hypothetical protein